MAEQDEADVAENWEDADTEVSRENYVGVLF